MKAKLLVLLSLIVCLVSCGGLPDNIEDLPVVYIGDHGAPAKGYENLTTLERVEEVSTDIVKGYLKNDSKRELQIGRGSTVKFGQTISTFVVTESYKGDLKADDHIKLYELYWIGRYEGKKAVFTRGNYLPSKPGDEYIFFLSKNYEKENAYTHIIDERGRYPVLPEDAVADNSSIEAFIEGYSAKALGLGEKDTSLYRALYAQVYKKYMQP